MTLLLGYDVGSSSIKAALIESQSGHLLATAVSPEKELDIIAHKIGWAEQHPEVWWENVVSATRRLKAEADFDPCDIVAIGISYQMHGLVVVDSGQKVLRPAIIWCDSRAVEIGRGAQRDIGAEKCFERLLNSPGNFTASKLKWVMENEPEIYSKIDKIMVPGDYIAMKMTGRIKTTPCGLSEAILWDCKQNGVADLVLDHYGISGELIPEVVPTFSIQGRLTKQAADELGLKADTVISYRAGDQPNNAFSLKVLEPGQVAVTAGTSGVVNAVTDKNTYDKQSRVNTFVHVNHTSDNPRYGVMLCVNGAGILNSWLRHNFAGSEGNSLTYDQMNELAGTVAIGCDGLVVLPYGNGAERVLGNRDISASVHGWNFNIHKEAHFLRAAQEGIVFALNFGLSILREMRIEPETVRAGFANMFLSPVFSSAFASLTGMVVELYNTDGSHGAARAAGLGAGVYKNTDEAFVGLKPVQTISPDEKSASAYQRAYEKWQDVLGHVLSG